MYQFTNDEIDVDDLRVRLSNMTDETLLRFGLTAAYMCSPEANYHEPREAFVVQLEEARSEWRRRKACAECAESDRLPKADHWCIMHIAPPPNIRPMRRLP